MNGASRRGSSSFPSARVGSPKRRTSTELCEQLGIEVGETVIVDVAEDNMQLHPFGTTLAESRALAASKSFSGNLVDQLLPNVAPRRRMSEFVADVSAVLAFARGEPGGKRVATVRENCVVSALTLLEAFSKLVQCDVKAGQVRTFLREAFPRVIPLDRELAESSAMFHALTHKLGLSYADCVCMMLGSQRKATVLTADSGWKEIDLDVKVELIR